MTDTTCNASVSAYPARPAADLPATARRFAGWLSELPGRAFATLVLWQGRANDRARIGQLDDRMLDDVGLTRADLEAESQKPFWTA